MQLTDRPIQHLYFIEDGLASVVAHGGRDQSVEVGLIGYDGVTGCCVLLGTDRSPNSIHMQIAGNGMRIATPKLLAAVRQSPTLDKALRLFVQALHTQSSQTALANGRATIEERLARWLLMAHDRLQTNHIALTHEFLSVMLGVRRPGVSVAMQKLETKGVITAQRSAIRIKDRVGLETLVHSFYGVAEAEQERLTGWRPHHRPSLAQERKVSQ
jgi:CRP-like cAMP-binding protein